MCSYGLLAQLVERLNGIEEVISSNLIGSTNLKAIRDAGGFFVRPGKWPGPGLRTGFMRIPARIGPTGIASKWLMKKLPLLLLLTGLLAWPLQGAVPVPATHDFLAAEAVDYRTLLTAPPAPDSIVARGEQQLMRHLQAVRTPAQAALAKNYEKLDVFKLLAPVLGDSCTAQNLPRTAAIFAQIRAEARPPIDGAKAAWNRRAWCPM